MKPIRGLYRLFFFVGFTIALILKVRWLAYRDGVDMKRFVAIRHRWTQKYLLPGLGVRVTVRGTPPDYPCIMMCNHRSYLDPVVICRDVEGFPVSKAEVADWPFVGLGARLTGVLFLKRESPQSRRDTLFQIADKVKEGFPVILFPEGTTHDKMEVYPLRRGAFQIAADEGLTILPVALDYRYPEDFWIGSATFLPHFIDRFGEKYLDAIIHYGTPLRDPDAGILIEKTQNWLNEKIPEIRREFLA